LGKGKTVVVVNIVVVVVYLLSIFLESLIWQLVLGHNIIYLSFPPQSQRRFGAVILKYYIIIIPH
jgi:hypothetical protein